MKACAILHNMIIKDERNKNQEFSLTMLADGLDEKEIQTGSEN
jgi:hypothetical protein